MEDGGAVLAKIGKCRSPKSGGLVEKEFRE